MTKKPNFLFFITDQHRADWLGCAGHPVVRTPNIDRLAARGTRFCNTMVAAPVCMPNRASLMTGRMPSVHGLRSNGARLPLSAQTFPGVLAEAGYETALIGKSHLQPFTPMPPLFKDDGKTRLIPEAWAEDPGDYGHEQPDRYVGAEPYAIPTPYYGFNHLDMVTGHGDRCGGHYQQWFRSTHPNWEALEDPANELPHDYICSQAYRTPVPEGSYPTAWIADRAIDWLGQRQADTPWFGMVSFPDPHHPFNPPGKYWDMYDPDDFAVDLPYEAHSDPTIAMRSMDQAWREDGKPMTPQSSFRTGDREVRETMALTAGMITMIDDQIGRVMEALEATGQADNTVVVFTSDHGDYMGDFNLMLKGPLPLRSINEVPLIWADPAAPEAAETEALVSTIDLSATILDRAGLEPYLGLQGRSFMPSVLDGAPHRDAVLTEFNDNVARYGFNVPARVRTLRTAEWRLTIYGGETWGELYHLRTDPRETHNLWDDPVHATTRADLVLRLSHALTAQMDECPRPKRMA